MRVSDVGRIARESLPQHNPPPPPHAANKTGLTLNTPLRLPRRSKCPSPYPTYTPVLLLLGENGYRGSAPFGNGAVTLQ